MARWFPVDLALKPCGPMFEAPDRPTARQIARDRGLFGWNRYVSALVEEGMTTPRPTRPEETRMSRVFWAYIKCLLFGHWWPIEYEGAPSVRYRVFACKHCGTPPRSEFADRVEVGKTGKDLYFWREL